MHFKVTTFVAAAATMVGLGTAAAGTPASAATSGTCQPTKSINLYSNHQGMRYYVAAPNNIMAGSSHPELKVFPGNVANDTATWVMCSDGGSVYTLEYMHNNVTYGLSNDHGDHNRIDIEVVSSSGPNTSMLWKQTRQNPYTFQDTETGLYLRVSNMGYGKYYPVVAGASKTEWNRVTLGS